MDQSVYIIIMIQTHRKKIAGTKIYAEKEQGNLQTHPRLLLYLFISTLSELCVVGDTCLCVCMYVWIHLCAHVCARMDTWVHVCVLCMPACMHACMNEWKHACIYVCMDECVDTCMYVYMFVACRRVLGGYD